MVYRVTLKHAHGKISHEAVMDLVKRLDGNEHAEFRMTDDGIHFQTGDAEAVISHRGIVCCSWNDYECTK
jgi:hypothetical protein